VVAFVCVCVCVYECGVIYMVLVGCEWCECIGVGVVVGVILSLWGGDGCC
jgi:hypothetical protein